MSDGARGDECGQMAEAEAVRCPACNGRGVRLYGREVEDGCDECEADRTILEAAHTHIEDMVEEMERLRAQLAQVTAERDALRANSGRWRDLFVALYETMSGDADVTDDSPDAIHNGLSAEVIRLQDAADETRRATEARDDAAATYDILVRAAWEAATGDTHEGPASVEVLLDAVRELRAIVEGRTTPPTWQEIERHHESGGSWIFSAGGVADVSERASVTHRWADDHRDLPGMGGCRWWPLDTHGRLCAWPVVTR